MNPGSLGWIESQALPLGNPQAAGSARSVRGSPAGSKSSIPFLQNLYKYTQNVININYSFRDQPQLPNTLDHLAVSSKEHSASMRHVTLETALNPFAAFEVKSPETFTLIVPEPS